MKFGVVVFPGSNCDRDLIHVMRDVMGQQVEVLWHKEHTLRGCDFILLPGGFSYGDYLRSGAIARFSPIMQEVMEYKDIEVRWESEEIEQLILDKLASLLVI